jgi:transformation/transcription domain-associated protein
MNMYGSIIIYLKILVQQLKDNANDFLRIDRFLPEIEVIRGYGSCLRRITIRGHDGSLHPFMVQNPAARHERSE